MPTPVEFKENLKQQADIVRVVGDYVRLTRAVLAAAFSKAGDDDASGRQ